MRIDSFSRLAAILWLASVRIVLAAPMSAPLPPDHLSVAQLPAPSPHWIYVYDEAFNNETDSRLNLYDGDAHRLLGQIDTGYYPGFSLSPDGHTMAVATTYWSRGGHGQHTDVIEFTDTRSLGITGEVVLAPTRTQGPPTFYNLSYSKDQRFIYSTNLTPAASMSVIDVAKKQVVADFDTDGCVQAYASLERRVSSICENGKLLSVTVDDTGHEIARDFSARFFDVDQDPVFIQAAPSTNGMVFLSFLGMVHAVDLTTAQPTFPTPWSLVNAAQRGHWRPGGTQMVALHKTLGTLYVTMHQGGEGSHKIGGSQIWVFDANTHRRIARWTIDLAKYGTALAVQVSQDEKPLLFVSTETSTLLTLDGKTGRLLHAEAKMGQTPWYLINP
jgi:methylamine dehydrogenase heavy chain